MPGVGPYTASAIASIAYDIPETVVDGNVERVISRIFDVHTELPKAKKELSFLAKQLTPKIRSGDYAQAIMDLGATICKPKKPDCLQCVISKHCIAYNSHKTLSIPLPKKRLKKKKLKCVTYLAIKDNKSVLLIQRKDKNILKDQWELPSTEWNKEETYEINLNSPIKNTKWKKSEISFSHSFTHIDLFNSIYLSKLNGNSSKLKKTSKSRWINLQNLSSYPLTTMSKKTLEMHNLI